MIPKESVELVLENAKILDVVGSYVPLEKKGRNYFGLCPFHDDVNPSLSVNIERNIYKCFACGAGGSAAGFIMEMDRVSFPEAVERLAAMQGVSISGVGEGARKLHYKRNEIYAANEAAAQFFADNLDWRAREYLISRGFTEEDNKEYRMGYAPDGWHNLEERLSERFSKEFLVEAGLLNESNGRRFDRFRSRIIFPIFDERGRISGFVGRLFAKDKGGGEGGDDGKGDKQDAKYVNSPETLVYKKREILYGLNKAKEGIRKTGEVIVVEGYTDHIALNRNNLGGVALGGIALTSEHALLLQRFGARRGYLCFDMDEAGVKAVVDSGLMLRRAGIEAMVVSLPEGMDPDDFLSEHSNGREGFLELVNNAESLLEFRLKSLGFDYCARKYDALHSCLPILAGVNDEIKRGQDIRLLAELLELPKEQIVWGLESYLQERGITADSLPLLSSPQGLLECEVLGIYLRWPMLRNKIREKFPVDVFSHGVVKNIAGWVYENVNGGNIMGGGDVNGGKSNGAGSIAGAIRDIHSMQIDMFNEEELSDVIEGVVKGVAGDSENLLLIMHRMFHTQRFEKPDFNTLEHMRGAILMEKRNAGLKDLEDGLLIADAERDADAVLELLRKYDRGWDEIQHKEDAKL